MLIPVLSRLSPLLMLALGAGANAQAQAGLESWTCTAVAEGAHCIERLDAADLAVAVQSSARDLRKLKAYSAEEWRKQLRSAQGKGAIGQYKLGIADASGAIVVPPLYNHVAIVDDNTAYAVLLTMNGKTARYDNLMIDLKTGASRPADPSLPAFFRPETYLTASGHRYVVGYNDRHSEVSVPFNHQRFRAWDGSKFRLLGDVSLEGGGSSGPNLLRLYGEVLVLRQTSLSHITPVRIFDRSLAELHKDRDLVIARDDKWRLTTLAAVEQIDANRVYRPLAVNGELETRPDGWIGFVASHPDPQWELFDGNLRVSLYRTPRGIRYRYAGGEYVSLVTDPALIPAFFGNFRGRTGRQTVLGRLETGQWTAVEDPARQTYASVADAVADLPRRNSNIAAAAYAAAQAARSKGDRGQLIADFQAHFDAPAYSPDGTSLIAKARKLGGDYLLTFARRFPLETQDLAVLCTGGRNAMICDSQRARLAALDAARAARAERGAEAAAFANAMAAAASRPSDPALVTVRTYDSKGNYLGDRLMTPSQAQTIGAKAY